MELNESVTKFCLYLSFYSQGLASEIQKYIGEKKSNSVKICLVLPTQHYFRTNPIALFRSSLVYTAGSGHRYAPQNSVELLVDIFNILDQLFS